MARALVVALLLISSAPIPVARAAERILFTGPGAAPYGSTWSVGPDGRDPRSFDRLYEASGRRVYAPNGRDSTRLGATGSAQWAEVEVAGRELPGLGTGPFTGPVPVRAAYAADGSAVALAQGAQAWLVQLPGGTITRLAAPPPATPAQAVTSGPVWSPDGTQLAFASRSQVVLVPIDGGTPTTLPLTAPADGAVGLDWSPAGDALVVGGDALVRIALPGGAQTVGCAASARAPEYSPSGDRIAYDGRDGVTVIDPDGRHAIAVGFGVDLYPGTFAWSPDGSRLAYAARGRLVTVARDGTAMRTLTRSDRALRVDAVAAWLSGVPAPAADTSTPVVRIVGVGHRGVRGTVGDERNSTPIVAVRVNVVRRAGDRCAAYARRRLRTMPCGQARRTWTAGTLVVDARGAFWHLLDPDAIVDFGGLEPGRYTVRVRVVDAAGNRDPAPPRAAYVIGGSSGRRVASQVGAAGSTP